MALEVAKDKKAAAALVEHTAPKQLEEPPSLGTATEGGSSSSTTTLAPKAKPKAAAKQSAPSLQSTPEDTTAYEELLELQKDGCKVSLG